MMILFILMLISAFPLSAEATPEWFLPLREAIYEQKLSADEIAPIYREISEKARTSLTGAQQLVILSRCEYFMGRALQFEERNREAAARYADGMSFAQRAIDITPSAQAWLMLAENLSQSCVVNSTLYAMQNGLNVEKFAKNALGIDGKNGAAQFLIAARWVYAPPPFHNYKKGIDMLNAIIKDGNMEKDDMFNVYSSIGYAYMQQRNKEQARIWFLKSLEIYPTNRYIRSLNEKL
ncbi:MAG: tetratricopeptide repeat protein [Treponema sp.]|jgi:tetratricopeptide (TPR) repeat protein|nr:tetratricopeptide repeat protein [Treponema sp.]